MFGLINLQIFFLVFIKFKIKTFEVWLYLKYFSNVIDIYSIKNIKPNKILWILSFYE